MKPWSERISSVSYCRQLSVQEDAVPPVPYPKQLRPGPMSNKKSNPSSPLMGIPPAVCHGKLRYLERVTSRGTCPSRSVLTAGASQVIKPDARGTLPQGRRLKKAKE